MKLKKPDREDYNSNEEFDKALRLYFMDVNDIYGDYDRNEDGDLLSCCGDVLDEDRMICATCGEHN